MDSPNSRLEELLSSYDTKREPILEYEVSHAIEVLVKEIAKEDIPLQVLAEILAFGFMEDYQDKETGWGTYFGPMMVFNNHDSTAVEVPSIKQITGPIIAYWAERAVAAKHPTLKARYANLVWEFAKVTTGISPDHNMARTAIDSTIAIAADRLHKYEVDIVDKLKRSLSLAISLNDALLIQRVGRAIVEFEDKVAEDGKPGLWGFSFDLLVSNSKVPIEESLQAKLINDLEARLLRVSNPTTPDAIDPWAADVAAGRLASFYRRIGRTSDVVRVLLCLGNAFVHAAKGAAALVAISWLEHVHTVYLEHGMVQEAEQIVIRIRDLGPKSASEMKSFSHEVKIPKAEVDKYIAELTDGNQDQVFARIVAHYIPKKSEVEKQLHELSEKAPISFLITSRLQDHRGRTIATIGPLSTDLTGHIVKQMSQNISFSSLFLRSVLSTLSNRYSSFDGDLVNYFMRSPIFDATKRAIFDLGIVEYLKGNYLSAIHLLVPQIEDTLRNLLEKAGGSVLKASWSGGYVLKNLNELLRDEVVIEVLGEDAIFYFRVVLTDQRGWNIRNDVCHGLIPTEVLGAEVADRLIHILLCLSQVHEKR